MARFIAVLILVIPGILAAYGIKLMRDALFNEFVSFFLHISIQFIAGLVLFIGGVAFIGGFIVHRDRKRQRIRKQNDQSRG
jgi:TRAP-type C4-dicarboxylate transport system permease small subunit